MLFVFRPEHMLGLAKGTLKVVSSGGVPLSMVRDTATGRIVGHAVGVVGQPFLAVPQLLLDSAQLIQTHRGFQKTYRMLDTLQNSVGVLQATTAMIGVGTVVGVALSAVNLHQTLKLREDVKQLKLEVRGGFIDMKKALKDQGAEIIQRVDQVAQDVKFEMHRLALNKAYGQFQQALRLIKSALLIEDLSTRNVTLGNAQLLLANALANYNEPHLLEATSAAGHLRRVECAWVIEQTMAMTFQLQNAPAAVSDQLSHLQDKIRQDSLSVIDRCNSDEELDFLFPELTRIHSHDLPVLESWQNQVDWIQTLSPDEQQLLASSDISSVDSPDSSEDLAVVAEPEEQLLYENLKQKSHYLSLRDQLKFMVKPDLRREHESYISQQAPASGLKALAPSNWQAIPDLTVANLYWYFKDKAAQA
ncbi:MAG: hypothetical protein ICV63_05715 [Coleofasciculus sp. Co-bin14]|nr:hypothetical protein [Coleofasciculus sp. Co-bin14]